MPPTNSLVFKILQFLSSIKGTLKVLKRRAVAVVLNECKCCKVMFISLNVSIQILSHLSRDSEYEIRIQRQATGGVYMTPET